MLLCGASESLIPTTTGTWADRVVPSAHLVPMSDEPIPELAMIGINPVTAIFAEPDTFP